MLTDKDIMGISAEEQIERKKIEGLFSILQNSRIGIDDIDEMVAIVTERLKQKLIPKTKNLQDGEHLTVTFRVDIIDKNGKVRGGSGSQRNMPEYIEWRKGVFYRDKYQCRHCGSNEKLNAHHIKSWAKYPSLRFDIDNGITLCFDCHAKEHPHIGFYDNALNSRVHE